jgi:hypothetical protein
MSTNGKVKIYKNPERKRTVSYKPYVPQYQQLGVEPEEYKSPLSPGYSIPKPAPGSSVNPRAPRAHIRRQQPYAEAVPSPIGRGKGPIPNVGNNMEQTWSGVDGEIIDDISGVDPDQPMVDNNEFVSAASLGLPDDSVMEVEDDESEQEPEEVLPELDEVANPPHKKFRADYEKSFLTENELQNALKEEYTTTVLKQLEEEEFLLLVDGAVICSGPADYIQEQTRAMVFGEHDLYHGNPVPVDDIVVLKRVKIKVGVFLE